MALVDAAPYIRGDMKNRAKRPGHEGRTGCARFRAGSRRAHPRGRGRPPRRTRSLVHRGGDFHLQWNTDTLHVALEGVRLGARVQLSAGLRGQALIALSNTVMFTVGFYLIGLKMWLGMGVFVGFVSFIPCAASLSMFGVS